MENHDWPDPDNPSLSRGFRERAQALRETSDHAIILNIRLGVVHEAQFLRGYSEWLVDLYRRPEIASRLMEMRYRTRACGCEFSVVMVLL